MAARWGRGGWRGEAWWHLWRLRTLQSRMHAVAQLQCNYDGGARLGIEMRFKHALSFSHLAWRDFLSLLRLGGQIY